MDTYDIQCTVVETIASVLKKELADIDDHVSFADLGADELDLFEFVLKMEDAFLIEISDADAQTLTSVAQTVSYIAARKL